MPGSSLSRVSFVNDTLPAAERRGQCCLPGASLPVGLACAAPASAAVAVVSLVAAGVAGAPTGPNGGKPALLVGSWRE